jgi:general stress protein YciG
MLARKDLPMSDASDASDATRKAPGSEDATEPEVAPRQRRKPGPRPGTEAARRGGAAARDKYGREFYSRIGAKGGSKVRERHGSSFYTEIGRRGGETTKRNLGTEHYSRIGRIGGKRAHGKRPADPESVALTPEVLRDEQ